MDSLPSIEAITGPYERLLQLARDRLDGPIQTRIRSWEDGEFELRVYHGYGPHPQRPRTTYRHVLRYHDGTGEWSEGLVAVDIEDPMDRTLMYKRELPADGVSDADAPSEKIGKVAGGD
ncbi:hypothetical protein [Haloarcula sp. JP-L23]|uniref:hypothetical protein n=1 Tax=Haloarcula sp. JP-L23 TaxID=2716717 RepID=UPI00140EA932|nr:hypothetical protein G9465_24675 [Haloarcula sp. JP-L23]